MKILVLTSSLLVAILPSIAIAQSTTRASVDSAGAQANGIGIEAAVSSGGRYVAFATLATNLGGVDANGAYDVYRHDTLAGPTVLVSANASGATGNGNSLAPGITPNGRFVTFTSTASDLVAGDTNGFGDVFVRDVLAGTTDLVSRSTSGALGTASSTGAAISDDGRFVAFASDAPNLVANDTNAATDVFVRDRQSGTTVRVSVSTSGVQGDAQSGFTSRDVSISGNGRYVAFGSGASNLVPGDTNGLWDVFVRDLQTGVTSRASIASNGSQANGLSFDPAISYDGRLVAFESRATNLFPGDTNARVDVYVHDRSLLFTIRASLSSTGGQGDGDSVLPAISSDGRWVAFASYATNLAPNYTAQRGIYVRDRETGLTTVETWNVSAAVPDGPSDLPAISPDGRFVAFESQASDLVPNDTNGGHDVFLRDRGPLPAYASYCFGDGTGSSCPCLDSQLGLKEGCPSSLGYGAKLTAHGNPNVVTDTFVLDGSQMPNSVALYLQGTQQVANGFGAIFGDGLLCVGGPIVRLGQETNANGASRYPSVGDLPISVRGAVPAASTRDYQVWYRNSANYCTFATANLTNAIEAIWGPCTICP